MQLSQKVGMLLLSMKHIWPPVSVKRRLRTADCGLQTADCRLPTRGKMQRECKMQTAD